MSLFLFLSSVAYAHPGHAGDPTTDVVVVLLTLAAGAVVALAFPGTRRAGVA